MAFLARVEGISSRSGVAVSCIGKLFIFQVIVLLVKESLPTATKY